MNKFVHLLFLLTFLVPFSNLIGQEVNGVVVEISKEKTVINGNTFYLHTVKKGENLYRISKAYNISQKDIVVANPETISGAVKEGQILKIPVDPAATKNIQQIESGSFVYHIAEEQQTVFSITQKYNVTKEELYKYNPELEFSPLQVGQVVRVPKSKDVSATAETFQPIENYIEYKVKKKETKYSISKEYNITVDELIAANPILNTEDLKTGSVIRIPQKSAAKFNTSELVKRSDSIVKVIKQPIQLEPTINKQYTGELKIALLLPFSIEENETRAKLDSVAAANAANNPKNKGNQIKQVSSEILPRTVYSLEFYQGFLLVVDSLKKIGLSIKVNTYDTERDVVYVNKILSRPEMAEMDMIIGPFFPEGLEKVNEFSLNKQIKLISPILKDVEGLKPNPYLFQVIPGDKMSIDALLRKIANYSQKQIILIEGSSLQDKELTGIFKERLNLFFPNSYKVITGSSLPNITKLYAESGENIVLVSSVDEAFVFSVFSKLNIDSKTHSIKVFGLPNCARFKNLDHAYFHNLEYHYFTPFYIDYSDPSIKHFYTEYKKRYLSEPQEFTKDGVDFALLGYDLGNYFIRTFSQNGDVDSLLNNSKAEQLHMKINFVQDTVSGNYINRELQILKFTKDYYLKKAD